MALAGVGSPRHDARVHVPAAFRTSRDEALAIADASPFATLIATTSLEVAHVPLLLDARREHLCGHVARASAIARSIADGEPLLAIFGGPHAYVSPRFYRTAPQVPTWNYVAAHVRGRASVARDDARARAIFDAMMRRFEPPDVPGVDSIPRDFVDSLLPGILAFDLAIESIIGKAKLGQNRARVDRESAIDALSREGAASAELAELMRRALVAGG